MLFFRLLKKDGEFLRTRRIWWSQDFKISRFQDFKIQGSMCTSKKMESFFSKDLMISACLDTSDLSSFSLSSASLFSRCFSSFSCLMDQDSRFKIQDSRFKIHRLFLLFNGCAFAPRHTFLRKTPKRSVGRVCGYTASFLFGRHILRISPFVVRFEGLCCQTLRVRR